jgi:hypothetical protein
MALSAKFAFKGAGSQLSAKVENSSALDGIGDAKAAAEMPTRRRRPTRSALAQRREGRGRPPPAADARRIITADAQHDGGDASLEPTAAEAEASSAEIQLVSVVQTRKPGQPRKAGTAATAASRVKGKISSRARSSSTLDAKGTSGQDHPTPGSSTLQLRPYRDPLPVPPWLGKPAVLLPLRSCPICEKKWAKSEQGSKRWVCHHPNSMLRSLPYPSTIVEKLIRRNTYPPACPRPTDPQTPRSTCNRS